MKVSICIPAYKHENFLKRCLNSVLEQDFNDFEVIITDDSPDNNLEKLVQTYTDKRIKYFKNSKALGSPSNWNEGISKAKGELVKILHHDDWFSKPTSLRSYIELLDNNPNVDIAFSGCCNINQETGEQKKHIADESFIQKVNQHVETVYLGNKFGAPSLCIFRNNKNYLFDPNLIWLVDTEFYIRVIGNKGFNFSSEVLVNIGVSQYQITHSNLTESKVRIAEKISLYNTLMLQDKSPLYKRSLLRALGREKVFNNIILKELLPDSQLSISSTDSIWAYYYQFKKKIKQML